MKVQRPALALCSLILGFGFIGELAAGTGDGKDRAIPKEKQQAYVIHCTIFEAAKNGERKVYADPTMMTVEGQESHFLSGGEIVLPDARRIEFGVSGRVTITAIQKDEVRVDAFIESKVPRRENQSDITVFCRSVRTVRNVRLNQVCRVVVNRDGEGAGGLMLELNIGQVPDQQPTK
jgi:hypothetical protein